ncbi:MAG: hypothetical protein ACI8WB_001561 [Phenylobacterium sp.]|jgi:hypothetical protein
MLNFINRARWRKNAMVIAVLLMLSLMASSFSATAIEPKKRDLQWAYMMNFIRYFSWPEQPHMTVNFCIIGRNPFSLDQGDFSSKQKDGKITAVKYHETLPSVEVMNRCQVIYFSSSITMAQLSFVFSKLGSLPIVTIADHQGFIKIGGILQFTEKNNKLRFRLNKAVLNTMNLKIHPALLRLSD